MNKIALSSFTWEEDTDGTWYIKSIFKMMPSMHAFDPTKRYRVTLDENVEYEGIFKYYLYRKASIDSPLIRVYIELEIELGKITIPEDSIRDYKKL